MLEEVITMLQLQTYRYMRPYLLTWFRRQRIRRSYEAEIAG
jgi:hypothetical protein